MQNNCTNFSKKCRVCGLTLRYGFLGLMPRADDENWTATVGNEYRTRKRTSMRHCSRLLFTAPSRGASSLRCDRQRGCRNRYPDIPSRSSTWRRFLCKFCLLFIKIDYRKFVTCFFLSFSLNRQLYQDHR